jgi:hypothetical protein
MAMTTNFPPQAYTRDTLVKAIEWLQSQPPSVRERAGSADLVVSYYLQACRKSAAQLEAPVSGENFKSDLKHLAQDLKQFEESSVTTIVPPHHPQAAEAVSSVSAFRRAPQPPPPPTENYFSPPEPIFKPEVAHPQPAPARSGAVTIQWPIDTRTLQAARELTERLNLSNETEALRLLVTLGAERAKMLFP